MTASLDQAASAPPTVGVVICAYSEQRWDDLLAAVQAVAGMLRDGDCAVVVVDHNDELLRRLRAAAPAGVRVVANSGTRGLSDARNTGVAAVATDVVAFLDDDAWPEPGWVEAFRVQFLDADVAAAGGAIHPRWDGGAGPGWFPQEFGWVIGCDYRGLPGDGAEIRNPIGASMAVRRELVQGVGGFSTLVGRVGAKPVGNEETELAIRIRQLDPTARIVRSTKPKVHHRVPRSRQTLRYFMRRCYFEGKSKAALTSSVGTHDGLSAERSYVTGTVVAGMWLHFRDGLGGDPAGFARAALLPTGTGATVLGYVIGRCQARMTGSSPVSDSTHRPGR